MQFLYVCHEALPLAVNVPGNYFKLSLPYFPDILPFFVKISEHKRHTSITFNSSEKVNFGDNAMERNFVMSDNKVLKNTLQIERNTVSGQIRGVYVAYCIVWAVISEATVDGNGMHA